MIFTFWDIRTLFSFALVLFSRNISNPPLVHPVLTDFPFCYVRIVCSFCRKCVQRFLLVCLIVICLMSDLPYTFSAIRIAASFLAWKYTDRFCKKKVSIRIGLSIHVSRISGVIAPRSWILKSPTRTLIILLWIKRNWTWMTLETFLVTRIYLYIYSKEAKQANLPVHMTLVSHFMLLKILNIFCPSWRNTRPLSKVICKIINSRFNIFAIVIYVLHHSSYCVHNTLS